MADLPLCARVAASDEQSQISLGRDGWYFVEYFDLYSANLKQGPYPVSHLLLESPGVDETIIAIIKETEWTSRLFADPNVSHRRAMENKIAQYLRAAARNDCRVYTLGLGHEMTAFAVLDFNSQAETVRIALIASANPGHGHGTLLLSHLMGKYGCLGWKKMTAGTSRSGPEKVGFYKKNHFHLTASYATFHKRKIEKRGFWQSFRRG